MSSNRHRFQEVLENHLGCPDPSQLKAHKPQFENLTVNGQLSLELFNALRKDIRSTYYKAALSIAESLVSIHRGHQSWAVVKLYYAIFYLVRLAFGVRGHGVFRCGTLFTLHFSENSKAEKRSGKGDHKTLINAFIKDYANSELILSNKINGQHVFDWLMDKRELIHYREATFNEPNFILFETTLPDGKLGDWISTYLENEDFVYCFLENHACLAAPLCFCRQILEEAKNFGIEDILTADQNAVLEKLLVAAGIFDNIHIKSLLTI